MAGESKTLFQEAHLSSILQNEVDKIKQELDGFSSDYMLKANIDDLTNHLVEKHTLFPIVLDDENICTTEPKDTQVDKSNDPRFAIRDYGRPIMVSATYVEYIIPFSGNVELFRFHPSRFSSLTPHGFIEGSELHIPFKRIDHDAEAMLRDFNSVLKSLKIFVEGIQRDIEEHNRQLPDLIRPNLESRRAKFLKDKEMGQKLGFPVRQRAGAQVYTAPIQRKKLQFELPKVTSEPFKPEPRLEMAEYEHILNTISNMSLVFERNHVEFVKMGEETLRTHILVQLNAQYVGLVTGETFNGEGKTDINIRYENKNIFIAECKFWKGAESFKETIDQLLSYTTWRDGKTAIVIFNRNKNTSAVLQQIPGVAKAHPNYRSETTGQAEARFRFIFNQKGDPNRQIILTVMVFDVPV
jgi:hypothetical protein